VPLTAGMTLGHATSLSAMPAAQVRLATAEVRETATAALRTGPARVKSIAAATRPPSNVRVAVANVREGAVIRPPTDLADADDRRAFGRRLFNGAGRVPDVVLLQEVLGTARAVTHSLNQHTKARRSGARYVVAFAPSRSQDSGPCAGARSGSYMSLRDSAIVVNSNTVTQLGSRGTVRTWGRWGPNAHKRTGRSGYGCAEQPWTRLSVQQAGKSPRTALVASVHVAPSGVLLKNRAIVRTHRTLDAMHRRTPRDLVVLAGDFNLTRCIAAAGAPETRGCAVRQGHRSLQAANYRDAVRSTHLTGSEGVVGVARRIDFLYVKGVVEESWFDRCYLAYHVKRFPCAASRVVFGRQPSFWACDRRSRRFGSPGAGCPAERYQRYYSDHPLLLGSAR